MAPRSKLACRLDGDLNCHCESDKVLICPAGSERLDITRDKCAVERKWQDAGGDKMPSATVVGFLPPPNSFFRRYHRRPTAD